MTVGRASTLSIGKMHWSSLSTIQALGEAIHELLKNKQLRLRLIENGLLTASKYNWDKVTADFAALILNLHKQRTAAGTIRSLL